MVHVPFFNIELPEPRLGQLMPDTVSAALRLSTKALEYGHDLLYPQKPEDIELFNQRYADQLPREFDRVRKRYAEGKILNDEQLSSELEDASFDWYRRQLRTSVLGATDEEMEDLTARKLGLAKPSLEAALHQQYLADAVAQAGGLDEEELVREALAEQAMRQREAEQRALLAARAERLEELRRQVQPASRHALGTITNASGGMLLGVLLFKTALVLTRRLFRRRKPTQRPQPQRRPQTPPPTGVAQALPPAAQQQQQRAVAAAAAPQAAAAARPQAAVQRHAQPQPQAQQQGAKGQAASQEAAAGAARKTRTVKKR